jgi:hypothetical protein
VFIYLKIQTSNTTQTTTGIGKNLFALLEHIGIFMENFREHSQKTKDSQNNYFEAKKDASALDKIMEIRS